MEPQRIVAKSTKSGGVVIDGRDVGTVVFPDATLKIFLIASIDERARRRVEQLKSQQVHLPDDKKVPIKLDEIRTQISLRDKQDEQRSVAPLKKALDAIEVDSSHLSIDQVVQKILSHLVV